MKELWKRKNGITLVALIITVILMLILAGVAISALATDENIFLKTQSAVEKYNNAVKMQNEKIETLVNDYLDRYSKNEEDTGEEDTEEEPQIVSFEYKPETQEYLVKKSGIYKIELWGAEGGHFSETATSGNKCKGAYTSGEIYLNKGAKLYIYTGEAGLVSSDQLSARTRTTTYNSGGAGGPTANGGTGNGGGGGSSYISGHGCQRGRAYLAIFCQRGRVYLAKNDCLECRLLLCSCTTFV